MKQKIVAVLLCFFLGGFGIHKFYLGQIGAGIIYLLFSVTFIPGLIAFFEFFILLFMSDAEFDRQFNGGLSPVRTVTSATDATRALIELKGLYEAGVITAEEYEQKRQNLLRQLPSDAKLDQRVGQMRAKVDINTCSKDDLVRLGVPLAYVNDIFTWRQSGHIFTHIEELGEMVGIPSATLQRISPLVIFTYNPRQEAFASWRRANNFSQEELLNLGLRPEVVQKLIEGRASGTYKSLLDITKRTGITIDGMRELI